MTPKFTVIVPVYNKLPHLDRSINSVLNQSFKDFELLLVDDGSSDGSKDKILEYQDARIKLYYREKPGPGGYAARNLGISKAKGEWVAFLDADDEWCLDHLEKMLSLIAVFPKVKFLSCGWEIQNNHAVEKNLFFIKHKDNGKLKLSFSEFFQNSIHKRLPLCTIVACVKNDPEFILNLFPEGTSAKRGGDIFSWLKLISYHKELAWSNHIGAIYHKDSVNMVTSNNSPSIFFYTREKFDKLSILIDTKNRAILSRFFNFKMRNVYINSSNDINLREVWKNFLKIDLCNAIYNLIHLVFARFKHHRKFLK